MSRQLFFAANILMQKKWNMLFFEAIFQGKQLVIYSHKILQNSQSSYSDTLLRNERSVTSTAETFAWGFLGIYLIV